MRRLLRAGERPKIAKIRQGDIFGLRDNPKFDADFVTFDFDPDSLSSVQEEIVRKWIRCGYNNIYLKDKQIVTYGSFFRPAEAVWRRDGYHDCRAGKLLRHSVNTDCKKVRFYDESAYRFKDCYYGFRNLPPGSTVIVEGDSGIAASGSFPVGEGRCFFRNTAYGTDARRWYLNWMHWALGLPVPGAADTEILGGAGITLEQAAQHDSVTLRNGDTITGDILNDSFTIQTSYGRLTFKRAEVEKIVVEGAGTNVDVLRLRIGDKLSGVLQDSKIRLRLVSGTVTELDKDKVKEVRLRREEGKAEGGQ